MLFSFWKERGLVQSSRKRYIKYIADSKMICLLMLLTVSALIQGMYVESNLTSSNVKTIETNPAIWTEEGLWGPLLEDWTIGHQREKRVMRLPPLQNAYVITDRKSEESVNDEEKESKIAPGKIVNNQNQKPQTSHQVSETDLYLLSAIEKLVYRVDFMEKRLRRVEEMLYYVSAGNRVDQEPCPDNFTRIGMNCYLFSYSAGREADWKIASKYCKRQRGFLAEMESIEENQDIIAYIQNSHVLRGKDFWTGGLNPGLLWIWSNSGRPVNVPGNSPNKTNLAANVPGEGRCLRLAYEHQLRSYSYRGTDCGARYSYICELPENSASNEISRIGRERKIFDEL